MSGTEDAPTQHASPGPRGALLAIAAILALVVAAFVMPPSAAGGPEGGQSTPTPTATPSGQPDGPGEAPGNVENVRIRHVEDGSTPNVTIDVGGDAEPDTGCFVVVWDRLVPGTTATVLVWNDGTPQDGRQVWFDGRRIGRTNGGGRVDGRVPYSEQLEVTVRAPDVERCTFLNMGMETGFDEWRDGYGVRQVTPRPEDVRTVDQVDGNVSATFPVVGEPKAWVTGEPFPGETVRLQAAVEDVPMRSATVTINGREVGKTDENGTYTLAVPDDGTETLAIAVTRGDFTADTTVEVLLLDAAVRPSSFLALPGQEAEVVTTLGDREASDVTVLVDGEEVGTTGSAGKTGLELPLDPRTTVTVRGYDQTATVAIWPLYLRTLLVGLLGFAAVVGSVVGTSRRSSARATRLVAGLWVIFGVLAVAWILGGRRGLTLVGGAGGLLALALAAFVYRTTIRRALDDLPGTVRRIAAQAAATLGRIVEQTITSLRTLSRDFRRLAIRVADELLGLAEWAAVRLRAGPALLVRAPRAMAALLGLVRSGLAGWRDVLPRLLAVGRTLARSHLTARRLGVLVLATTVVGAGYAVGQPRVALVAVAVLLAVFGYGRQRADATPTDDGGTTAPAASPGSGGESAGRPALRTLWRTFARWVVPGRWTSLTPGEIARSAVDQGFPRGPVEQLRDVFREVEYGDRSLSDERYARAREAFQALRDDEEGTE